jgi:serine/threonine-protein kinase HipA
MKKIKELLVSTLQGDSGKLMHESRYVFNYTTTDHRCETSLLMPIRAESYSFGAMLRPFTMNFPEGFLKERIVDRLEVVLHEFITASRARCRFHAKDINRTLVSR